MGVARPRAFDPERRTAQMHQISVFTLTELRLCPIIIYMFTKIGIGEFMNSQELDIMKILFTRPFVNQRILAEESGHSLGVVNRSLKNLMENGYVDRNYQLTGKALPLLESGRPRNAVIMAAGFGMRMVPINLETPKAFLEVGGEPLIERQIRQLHEAGVTDITVVIGFMKEKFEYLIDEFGVNLVVNREYASKNNLYTINLVADRLSNTYIIPCDIRCAQNPFSSYEPYSWYMVSEKEDPDSDVRCNRKRELVRAGSSVGSKPGNAMIGIAYLDERDAAIVRDRVRRLCREPGHDGDFWEEALYEKGRMIIPGRVVGADEAVEINTYEELRDLDSGSGQLQSEVLDVIARVFECGTEEITQIEVLKKGMTNRSFLFSVKGGKYIMRVPGEGTDKLINRRQEADVYRVISGKGLCDDPVYLDPETGYKITRYLQGVRVCDPDSVRDLRRCMTKLRQFHESRLKVGHEFDIFGQIEFYESLWGGRPSVYRDYARTKERVLSLRPFIEEHVCAKVLTHIDAVPDNFLFYTDENGTEELQLTDWEYAGMQDPHVDIAMFCIYSMYDKRRVDRLIGLYFDREGTPDAEGDGKERSPEAEEARAERAFRKVPAKTVAKIYAYIAACGLLWSNWCEYKLSLGVEFGEYSLRQYRYAKDYYRYAAELIQREADPETGAGAGEGTDSDICGPAGAGAGNP